MKAEELTPKDLRIGNILREKYTGDILVVSELTKDRITFDYQTLDKWQAEPIPLSEEVLLKCSAYLYDELDGEYRINDTRYSIHKVTNFDGFLLCDGNNVLTELKHLHQLQNIYYALTGEELEVIWS